MSESTNRAFEVTDDELLVITNSINEVLHGPDAIEDWEFQTRIGVDRHFAEKVLAKIGSVMRAAED